MTSWVVLSNGALIPSFGAAQEEPMNKQFSITWVDRGHPPRVAPNPAYQDGIDVDIAQGAAPSCTTALPYPTGHVNVGTWIVQCKLCGLRIGITAASRPDDPRSVKLPCKKENNNAMGQRAEDAFDA